MGAGRRSGRVGGEAKGAEGEAGELPTSDGVVEEEGGRRYHTDEAH